MVKGRCQEIALSGGFVLSEYALVWKTCLTLTEIDVFILPKSYIQNFVTILTTLLLGTICLRPNREHSILILVPRIY